MVVSRHISDSSYTLFFLRYSSISTIYFSQVDLLAYLVFSLGFLIISLNPFLFYRKGGDIEHHKPQWSSPISVYVILIANYVTLCISSSDI